MVGDSLTGDDFHAFVSKGVIVKRSCVPKPLTARAIELITDWYISEMDARDVAAYTERTFAPQLGEHPDLLALFYNSGVDALARELVGSFSPVTKVQVQLRLSDSSGIGQPWKDMHVDGVSCPHLDPAELRTFTLLVGIVLSDIASADDGALHYVEGGHLAMSKWFRDEWSLGITSQVPPQIDATKGFPFLGDVGDVLLMHHLVPHAVSGNASEAPRIMAYFRISHSDHTQQRLEALRDPWLEYPRLRIAGLV